MLRYSQKWRTLVETVISQGVVDKRDSAWASLLSKVLTSPETLYSDPLGPTNITLCELNKAVDVQNLITNFEVYSKIYNIVEDFFLGLSKHHQHAQIRVWYSGFGDNTKFSHLWSLGLFVSIASAQPVVSATDAENMHVFASVVEHSALEIKRLFELSNHTALNIPLIVLKKYTHILWHKVAEAHGEICKIFVEAKTNVIDLKEFFKTEVQTPAYSNQITILQVFVLFKPNSDRRFNISSQPVKILSVGQAYYVYSSYVLAGQPLIIQHYNKMPTTLTPAFLDAVQVLGCTKFNVDKEMGQILENLVVSDIEKIFLTIRELTGWSIASLPQAKASLGTTQRKVFKVRFVRNFIQNLLVQELTTPDIATTVKQLAFKTGINAALLKTLFRKNKDEHQLISESQTLQTAFSHLYLYEAFLTYLSYVSTRDYVYFYPYSDFRGRLYYKSEASPQSLWCFRFLYYYDIKVTRGSDYPLYDYQQQFLKRNPTLQVRNLASIEFFHAIGVVFKSKLICKKTGALRLADLLQEGYDRYLMYSKDIFYVKRGDVELKDWAEIVYYMRAFETERLAPSKGYYIWKDTTASVAQHGGKLLGYKPETLRYLNLDNELVAYDTYQIIINEITKELGAQGVSSQILNCLTRKLLKQLIMTCEYQVSYQTARNKYLESVAALVAADVKYECLQDAELFKKIFSLLKAGIVAKLFYVHTQEFWYHDQVLQKLSFGDLSFDATYYLAIYRPLYFDIKNGAKRKRAVLKSIVPVCEEENNERVIINTRKTHQAAYVNFVHAYDAAYLRSLLRLAKSSSVEMAAIHDGFAVAYYNSKWLIGAANTAFWPLAASTTSLTIII